MLILLFFFFSPSLLKALYNVTKSVPPFKSPAITSETENVRNFKGSPAAKGSQEKSTEEKEFLVCEQVIISLKERHIYCLIVLIVFFSNMGMGFKHFLKLHFIVVNESGLRQ